MELDQEKSRQDFLHGKLKLLVYQSGPGQRRDGELLRAYLCPAITVKSNVPVTLSISQITFKVSGFKQWKSFFNFHNFCRSGIQTEHHEHNLALLREFLESQWEDWKPGAGIFQGSIHSLVWWVMLALGLGASLGLSGRASH